MQSWGERGIGVEDRQQSTGRNGYSGQTMEERNMAAISCVKNKPSWDFVNNGDPVITAATAAECHESDFVQRQWDLVGDDVVLDVVCNALAESLDGEAEQSALDRNAVPR